LLVIGNTELEIFPISAFQHFSVLAFKSVSVFQLFPGALSQFVSIREIRVNPRFFGLLPRIFCLSLCHKHLQRFKPVAFSL
jgi:hypothetical protein